MDEELYELLKQKRKIEAVKYVRNKYDIDFKRAKETVDKLVEKVEYFDGKNLGLFEEDYSDNKNLDTSEISDDNLYALIKENRKVEAIKYVREKYNFDLKTAKNIVDSLDINNLMAFTEKNIVSASKTDFSKCGSGYRNESYSYEMIDGKQHFFAYKDGEKREVGRTAIPSEILKWFEKAGEKASDEYEDKEYRKKISFGEFCW
ncbi:ribosomal protein L7/L12 C-terminal-like domain protein [Parvimonas sp. oral taxon 393 str. F0440]|nr:ribosomal protein L7/L12 C-terminal-like domain protein [Parvimonas sp. oral taxon 393 str. F0440]